MQGLPGKSKGQKGSGEVNPHVKKRLLDLADEIFEPLLVFAGVLLGFLVQVSSVKHPWLAMLLYFVLCPVLVVFAIAASSQRRRFRCVSEKFFEYLKQAENDSEDTVHKVQ